MSTSDERLIVPCGTFDLAISAEWFAEQLVAGLTPEQVFDKIGDDMDSALRRAGERQMEAIREMMGKSDDRP